ncbi:hypothetical protein ONS95_002165 [Cadophora gregata]|uniref:uncharacterized protein n=1 Tax=Cadophora gregata TaxID=51156 RepID=UPI0026DB7D77|nr:uncharacterized protein ONS95_002165 [Cadophora gregata]KAK0109473.1 hypothetical protein ONS95_002165 [Cadophora gregata]KAK0110899.1 hypothetical protein ONS96_002485 [Cadophora gregata f. sp. sojae]
MYLSQLNTLFVLASAAFQQVASEPLPQFPVTFKGPFSVEEGGIQNINVIYEHAVHGELTVAYGPCEVQTSEEVHHRVGKTHIGDHHLAARHIDWDDQRPTKFVWIVPTSIDEGCLHAYLEDQLIGTSPRFTVKKRVVKRGATFADVADPMGP